MSNSFLSQLREKIHIKDLNIKILLIEDDVTDAKLISKLLSDAGRSRIDIINAGTLTGGMVYLRKEPFDLVLLDLKLPDNEGVEGVEKIKNEFSMMPIVVLTGQHYEELATEAIRMGAQDYLRKDDISAQVINRTLLYAIERQKNENTYKLQQAHMHSVIENTDDAIWALDRNLNITLLNHAFARFYKKLYGNDISYGAGFMSAVPRTQVMTWQNSFKQCLLGQSFINELEFETPSGRLIYRFAFKPIMVKDEISGISVYGHDLTFQKNAESIVKESEDRFLAFMKYSPAITWIKDEMSRYVYMNRIVSPFDKGVSSVVGKTDFELLPKEIASRFFEADRKVINSNERHESIYETNNEDGTSSYWLVNKFPLQGQGQHKFVGGIAVDVTAQHQAEQNLLKSEKKYRTLIETMNEGLIYMDRNNKLKFSNPRFAEILGYSHNEIEAMNGLIDLVHEQDRSLFNSNLSVNSCEKRTQFEIRLKAQDDTWKWLMFNCAAIFDNRNEGVMGFLCTVVEISKIKHTEKKLRDSNQELNTFIYKLSHDLKGPMASILGITNVAKLELTDTNALRYMDYIQLGASRLDSILRDLVDTVRIKEGTLNATIISFQNVINHVMRKLDNTDGYDDIKWEILIDEACQFQSDAEMIQTAMFNLLDNAIRYRAQHDSAEVSVRVKVNTTGAILCIEDNGVGIAEAVQQKVFDMFYRGNTESKGTGLGLYIAKNAVEKLNGHIELTSTEGKGTRVDIVLPYIEQTQRPGA